MPTNSMPIGEPGPHFSEPDIRRGGGFPAFHETGAGLSDVDPGVGDENLKGANKRGVRHSESFPEISRSIGGGPVSGSAGTVARHTNVIPVNVDPPDILATESSISDVTVSDFRAGTIANNSTITVPDYPVTTSKNLGIINAAGCAPAVVSRAPDHAAPHQFHAGISLGNAPATASGPGISGGAGDGDRGAAPAKQERAEREAVETCPACRGSARSYHFGHLVCGVCKGMGWVS